MGDWIARLRREHRRDQDLKRIFAAVLADFFDGEIVHAAKRKKSRSGNKPPAKAARVKLVLPSSGVCIVASGQGLTLDGLCDALGEAQKAARAALAQDHDIKSFPAAMAAKNKKRGTP